MAGSSPPSRRRGSSRKTLFNCQTAPGFALRATPGTATDLQTRVIAPCYVPAAGHAGHSCSFSPRGVRNDRAFHRARGAMCGSTWLPCAFAHGNNNSLGRRSSPAFRTRMDFSACCITDRELSLAPTRRPDRASCRTGMHLDRPPVASASISCPTTDPGFRP